MVNTEKPPQRFPHHVELKKWREGRIRPLPGNSPHDRPVSRGCLFVKENLRPSLSRHCARNFKEQYRGAFGMRFLRDGGIYHPDVVSKIKTKPWGGAVPPPAGRPRAQVKERARRITPSSSFVMSSGRLFLDRVARQHCPSPLHRHTQITMHFSEPKGKGDISTLPGRGHFYFALTPCDRPCQRKVEMSYSLQSRNVLF
jgi:hypothetical protein